MPDQHFFSAASTPAAHSDVFGPLLGGERRLWQGRCAVAEYAFDEAASLPRWALPETTEVLVTDHRVVYAYTRSDSPDDVEVTSGELRWQWPQHLRLQPGALTTGRAAAAAQIQLVCAASDGSFPALVFAGGDLATVQDADRLANTIRHAIAHFRVDNADKLGLTALQARMLSRLLIGPEFSNYQGGDGQTVTLLGAMSVHRPAEPAPLEIDYVAAGDPGDDLAAESLLLASLHEDVPPPAGQRPAALEPDPPRPAPATYAGTRLPGYRPGLAADEARALQAAAAEEATQLNQPDLASRAASLAARIASLVSATEDHDRAAAAARAAAERADAAERAQAEWAAAEQAQAERAAAERAAADQARATRAAEQAAADHEQLARAQAAQLAADRARAEQARAEREQAEQAAAAAAAAGEEVDSSEVPTTDLSSRAAAVRRAAARFAANAAKGKAPTTRRIEPEIGSTSRGNRHR